MLKKELESTTEWFKDNSMTSNLDKFSAIILHKDTTDVTHKLRIYDNEIETTKSVKLLWVQFDNQIKFKNLISTLCFKAAMQLNALYKLQRYMGKTEKECYNK